jgi:hypothetical protein
MPCWFASIGAHDVRLNYHVGGTADHQEMFNVVTAYEHQASASVDCHGIEYRQSPWFTLTRVTDAA